MANHVIALLNGKNYRRTSDFRGGIKKIFKNITNIIDKNRLFSAPDLFREKPIFF